MPHPLLLFSYLRKDPFPLGVQDNADNSDDTGGDREIERADAMNIADIRPSGEVFIDGVDRSGDIRKIPGCRDRVVKIIRECLMG